MAEETGIRAMLEQVHEDAYGWAVYCSRGDRDEAAELLHSVYLMVLQGKARFAGRSSFKTWIFAVIRRVSFRRRMSLAASMKRLGRLAWKTVTEPSGESGAIRSELRDRIQRLLETLSRRQRQVLQLVFYHEMTVEEAASVMNVSTGSARTHYDRGKKRLAEEIRKSGIDHDFGQERSENQALV